MSVASSSSVLKFHDLSSGNLLHSHTPKSQGPIHTISWSKDGNWLALVPHTGPTEIVSIKEQLKLVHIISSIEEPTAAVFQNTTKRNLAIGTKTGGVFVYDIKNRKIKTKYPCTDSTVTLIAFTAKDSHVIAACENGEAYIYSNTQNVLSGVFKIPRSEKISALRTSPLKRNYIAAGSDAGVVTIWDIHSNKHKFFIGSHKAPITDVVFSPIATEVVVSAGLDRQLCIYDIVGNKCIASIFVENNITAIDFSPDGQSLVAANHQGKICIYDSKNFSQPVQTFHAHEGAIQHLAFRKNQDSDTSFNISCDSNKEPVPESNGSAVLQLSVGCERVLPNNTTEPEDSFLAAIGGTFNKEYETTQCNTSRKLVTPYVTKSLRDKILSEINIPQTSTPELGGVGDTELPVDSPICNMVPVHGASLGEINAKLEALGAELRMEIRNSASQIRQMFMDLLMFQVKESIKVENLLSVNPSVQEENLILKERIAVLEEELSLLKTGLIK